MISKDKRNKILNSYTKKQEKLFVAGLIDNINKFEINNYVVHTSFLTLNEKFIALEVLNSLKVGYKVFDIIEDIERSVIFLIPDYMNDVNVVDIFDEYISVLKIIPSVEDKLLHKDYMGAIYSLGIKENMIGDIFISNQIGYVFLFKNVSEYFLNNLLYVSKIEVKLELLSILDSEVKSLHLNFKTQDIIVSSLRVDTVLASIYNLSRNEVRAKIENGDLFINSKEMFFVAYNVNENDIVSFRKKGKFKIGKIIRKTKSLKTVLNIKKYM